MTCRHEQRYDGCDDGIFVFTKQTAFLHEVMQGYIDAMLNCRMPFFAYHSILSRSYERSGHALCSNDTLRDAILSFINLVHIDQDEAFRCPQCSLLPAKEQIVILDGKCMGFRSDLSSFDNDTSTVLESPSGIQTVAIFSFIQKHYGLTQLLRSYTSPNANIRMAVKHQELIRRVKKYVPELECMVRENQCPPEYRDFLRAICTEYPLATLIPHAVALRLEYYCSHPQQTFSVSDKQLFQYSCPLLHSLLVRAKWSLIPTHIQPLFKKLASIALAPGEQCTAPTQDDLGESETSLTFFPCHTMCRHRVRLHNDSELHRGGGHDSCTKHVKFHRTFTPGIFIAMCPHGICLGFDVMKKFEGPLTAFDVLYTRFREAPGIVVYDNACQLSRTCYKLAAQHFRNTVFVIDRMHWSGHVACHQGYCMAIYPNDSPIGKINSQAAEQCNAKLELIDGFVKFMNQDHFCLVLRFFLAMKNIDKLKTLVRHDASNSASNSKFSGCSSKNSRMV